MSTPEKNAPSRKPPSKSAIRYSPEQKAEVVAFVRDYDKTHGKGGQAAASRKFGISAISISAWTKTGVETKKTVSAKKVTAKAAPAEGKPSAAMFEKVEALRQMVEIQEQMEDLQSQYEALKGTL